MMEIKIAKNAGFCLGVELALEKLDNAILQRDKATMPITVATLGPIIHNPSVLNEYKNKKVKIVENIEDITNDMALLIRAHGIPKDIEGILYSKAKIIIDATCPKVKAAQLAIEKATKKAKINFPNKSLLLLYGEQEHPEVQGLLSYSHIPYIVLSKQEDIYSIAAYLPEHVILAAQTTQNNTIYNEIKDTLENTCKVDITLLNTICNATQKRQESVKELVKEVDTFIVIGGKNSSNTKRLCEVATLENCQVLHIENSKELNISLLNKELRYGITAGASTPKSHIIEVEELLKSVA